MDDRTEAHTDPVRELERLRARVAELEECERQRRRAELELRESEQQYRAIVEDQTEFVVRHTPDGRLTFVNEAVSRYVGQSPVELVGQSIYAYIIEADHEAVQSHLTTLTPERPADAKELRVDLPSGERRWHRWTIRAIFDRAATPVEFQSVGRDITEEVLAKEALVHSEERLRSFVESATDCFIQCDAQLNLVELNTATLQEMGLADKAGIIGRPLADFVPSIAQSGRIEQYRAVARTGVPVFVEDICPGGYFGDQHFSVRAFKMGDGVGFVMRNTSERARVARQLQESEARYRELFEHVPVGLYRSTPAGALLDVNSALVQMLGHTDREDLLNVNVESLYVDPDSRRALLQRIDRDGVAYALEFQLRHRDGTPLWVRENARVIRDANGMVRCYEGSLENITERKQAEATLRETTTTLNSILQSTTEYAIAATDLDLRIVHCNPAVERVFGLPLNRVLGRRVVELHKTAGVAHERVTVALETAVREGRWESELRMAGATGRPRIVHPVVMPMYDEAGARTGYVVLARDVTRERLAEEARDRFEAQLRHVHKLQAIGQLAAGVAHDFNSVLMIILGNAELLQAAIARQTTQTGAAKSGEQLGQILSAVERGRTLVQKLLAFGRARSWKPQPVDLNERATHMHRLLEGVVGANVEFRLALGSNLRPVHADPGHIEQALMNLILNARDAMPHGGTLTLETANLDLGPTDVAAYPEARTGPYVVLTVCDSGTGMDSETLARVFDPFFSTKPLDQGTGLGLSIVYGIVKQAGGHMAVESKPDLGTTFRLFLPVET